jgi:hypothetical protein
MLAPQHTYPGFPLLRGGFERLLSFFKSGQAYEPIRS